MEENKTKYGIVLTSCKRAFLGSKGSLSVRTGQVLSHKKFIELKSSYSNYSKSEIPGTVLHNIGDKLVKVELIEI